MHLKDYFIFTKKERVGIYTLLALIAIFQAGKYMIPYFVKERKYDYESFRAEIAQLKMRTGDSAINETRYTNDYKYTKYTYHHYAERPANNLNGELFEFDPNTLDEAGWRRLGVKEKTISTILKFTSKGGKFYKPEDISKIWGLHEELAKRLIPYVRITGNENAFSKNQLFDKKTFTKEIISVDINASDSTAYESLPGIGPKLASRIISFRDKLGGFYSVSQVAETYGLPDSTYQKIKPQLKLEGNDLKLLNINTATLEQLRIHPYIRYHLANAIIEYRKQHGDFKEIADLKKIMIVTDEVYNKLKPYLTL